MLDLNSISGFYSWMRHFQYRSNRDTFSDAKKKFLEALAKDPDAPIEQWYERFSAWMVPGVIRKIMKEQGIDLHALRKKNAMWDF